MFFVIHFFVFLCYESSPNFGSIKKTYGFMNLFGDNKEIVEYTAATIKCLYKKDNK